MKVLIIGCGLIGRKRANALSGKDKLVACCDINEQVGKKFAEDFSCKFYSDYKTAIRESNADIVVISVINKFMKGIVTETLKNYKHVLVEKPLGRNFEESYEMIEVYKKVLKKRPGLKFKVGFNHRFHPAIWEAKKIIDKQTIGKLFSIRARYGHGGRIGMEKEWRASKELCGGGELLDQGVHVIDLIRWFGGEVNSVMGKVYTKFWNMEVEDNAYVILETENNITAQFNVSWTNWKNIFSFEIFGENGYVSINGLGGSYGLETLEVGIKRKEGGRPIVKKIEYPPEDLSWEKEWREFLNAIQKDKDCIGNYRDGEKANLIIKEIYNSNKKNKLINVYEKK